MSNVQIRLTNLQGTSCGRCGYLSNCQGCPVPFSDDLVTTLFIGAGDRSLCVYWSESVIAFYDDDKASHIVNHER